MGKVEEGKEGYLVCRAPWSNLNFLSSSIAPGPLSALSLSAARLSVLRQTLYHPFGPALQLRDSSFWPSRVSIKAVLTREPNGQEVLLRVPGSATRENEGERVIRPSGSGE